MDLDHLNIYNKDVHEVMVSDHLYENVQDVYEEDVTILYNLNVYN